MTRSAVVLLLLMLPLAQAASLSGQILDQHGDPVAGADVYLHQWAEYPKEDHVEECSPDGTCRAMAPSYQEYHSAQTKTGSDGRYKLEAIQGWGQISVSKQGYAGAYEGLQVDNDTVLDLKMLKFPDKTAHIEGRITSGGQPIRYASLSIENPEFGVYECSVHVEDQQGEPRMEGSGEVAPSSPPPSDASTASSEPTSTSMIAPDYYDPGCAITIQADGTFSGDVTPGYSIIRVYVQSWRDSDREEYYPLSRVMTLPADATTRLDLQVTARPGPDARLSGYVIDATTQKAIPGAQVSFGNLDGYGWANAQTDKDGSYRVALRSGMNQISVWAEGYFPWEGQLVLAAGDDRRYDIVVTPGESKYGGYCCIAYAEDRAMAAESDGGVKAAASPSSPSSPAAGNEEGGENAAFEDLGGGLGPYDPSKAQSDDLDQGAPGFEIAFVLLALAAIVLVRRK